MTDMEDWWLSKLHFIRLPQDTVYWLYSSYHGYLQFKYDILKYFNIYYDEATRLQLELENKVISIDNTPTNGFEFVPLITQSGERSSSFAIKDPRVENSQCSADINALLNIMINQHLILEGGSTLVTLIDPRLENSRIAIEYRSFIKFLQNADKVTIKNGEIISPVKYSANKKDNFYIMPSSKNKNFNYMNCVG